jgi:hypothetical protein
MKNLLLLALIVPAAACASARAETKPVEQPPMVVPPAPPRVIEAMPATVPEPLEPVAEIPTTPASPPRPRPQRDPAKGGTDPKVETKPPDTPPDPASAQPTQPVPPLRPQGSADGPELARQVRETLDRAAKMLDSIDLRTLSAERRVNYDAARDFIKQAEGAITEDKLVFAKSLAERAEQVAKQLGGVVRSP